MASPFDRIMSTAKMRLPGAVDDAMRQELFDVCIEFFSKAAVWTDRIDFTMYLGARSAEVSPVAGRILKLMAVYDNKDFPQRGFTMPSEGIVQARYDFNVNTPLYGIFMMTVTDPVTRDAFPIIPLELVGRYHEVFMDGLLYKMFSHPSKPYTNLAMAGVHLQRFKGGISRARNEVHTENTMGSQNWSFPRFA